MLCCPHCSMLSTILFSIVTPDCGLNNFFNIVDNIAQCGQHNIVQSCFQQPSTTRDFLPCTCYQITEYLHLFKNCVQKSYLLAMRILFLALQNLLYKIAQLTYITHQLHACVLHIRLNYYIILLTCCRVIFLSQTDEGFLCIGIK